VASEAAVIGVGATGSSQLIVHWGADGDRFGPWWTYPILVAAIGLPIIALIGFFIARSTRMAEMNNHRPTLSRGRPGPAARGCCCGSTAWGRPGPWG
jgi:hypothetical protein